ncbi:hypothetical protein E2C01_097825 [Portunus trituberculatus]|uniref:Uncharacterized protein n=1 Tax=Portunus trituberculatus TaxID=210409 RepID=A0A5B7K6Q0_PORTR|nr:hypothetical protein [Portunus trituberculatus]
MTRLWQKFNAKLNPINGWNRTLERNLDPLNLEASVHLITSFSPMAFLSPRCNSACNSHCLGSLLTATRHCCQSLSTSPPVSQVISEASE